VSRPIAAFVAATISSWVICTVLSLFVVHQHHPDAHPLAGAGYVVIVEVLVFSILQSKHFHVETPLTQQS
jgi:hypothetical protein